MDGTKVQTRIHSGLAKAAKRLGLSHSLYRPVSAGPAIHANNLVGTVLATFSEPGSWYTFNMPSKPGKAFMHCLVDGAAVQAGDYLVRGDNTFFISHVQHIAPVQAIECNAVLSLRRAAQPANLGFNDYGGDIEATETTLLDQWPGSVRMQGRGAHDIMLPGDAGLSSYHIQMPARAGIIPRSSDILRDENDLRYLIKGVERWEGGWNISAVMGAT